MDELATAAGMYSEKLGKDYRIFLYTGLYYPGHPPYRIFRWDYKVESSRDKTDFFTALTKVEDENYAVFFHHDTWQNLPYFKSLFPEAEMDYFAHEAWGKQFDILKISNENIKQIRGLDAEFRGSGFNDKSSNSLPVITGEENRRMPYTAIWKGRLFCPYYGRYSFRNRHNTAFEIRINGKLIQGNKEVILAKGFHNIEVRSEIKSPADKLSLYMNASRYTGARRAHYANIDLNERYLYNIPRTGLHASYYVSDVWDESVVLEEEIIPLASSRRIYQHAPTSRLSGRVLIREGGEYKFYIYSHGYTAVVINNRAYFDTNNMPAARESLPVSGLKRVSVFKLSKGEHKIDIYTYKSARMYLKWGVNGRGETDIPFDVLIPEDRVVFVE